MLVYDVTRRSTFEALEKWMHEISLVKKSYLDVLHTRLYLIVSDSSRIYQKKKKKKKKKKNNNKKTTKSKQQQKKQKKQENNNNNK